jgi:hypothetical protein
MVRLLGLNCQVPCWPGISSWRRRHSEPVSSHGFVDQPVGFQTTYTFNNGDGTFTLNAQNLGPNFSGINNTTFGNLFGFNIGQPPDNKWLGFPGNDAGKGSATFNLTIPTHSFGGFLTGLQGFHPLDPVRITFNDGTDQVLTFPSTLNGGAEYFGLVDTATFSSFTISGATGDAWGLDGISFNSLNNFSDFVPVPGPIAGAGVPGLILASGGLLGCGCRKSSLSPRWGANRGSSPTSAQNAGM